MTALLSRGCGWTTRSGRSLRDGTDCGGRWRDFAPAAPVPPGRRPPYVVRRLIYQDSAHPPRAEETRVRSARWMAVQTPRLVTSRPRRPARLCRPPLTTATAEAGGAGAGPGPR